MAGLTQMEAADRLGITTTWLRMITKRDIISRNPDDSYPWPKVRDQFREFQQNAKEEKSAGLGDEDYKVARARRVTAQARLAEIELEVREGELVSVDDHRAVLAKVLDAFRSAMLSMPGAWGPRIVGIQTPAEGTETMRVAGEEILRDMAAVANALELEGSPEERLLGEESAA